MAEKDAASVQAQVKELREGDFMSQSIRLPLTKTAPKTMTQSLTKMRNRLNQAAMRAKETTERTYRVEAVQALTHDGQALIGTVMISCIEDEGEDDI